MPKAVRKEAEAKPVTHQVRKEAVEKWAALMGEWGRTPSTPMLEPVEEEEEKDEGVKDPRSNKKWVYVGRWRERKHERFGRLPQEVTAAAVTLKEKRLLFLRQERVQLLRRRAWLDGSLRRNEQEIEMELGKGSPTLFNAASEPLS